MSSNKSRCNAKAGKYKGRGKGMLDKIKSKIKKMHYDGFCIRRIVCCYLRLKYKYIAKKYSELWQIETIEKIDFIKDKNVVYINSGWNIPVKYKNEIMYSVLDELYPFYKLKSEMVELSK